MEKPIIIEINNWEKYQSRHDIKNPWWFKMHNRFFEDPRIMALDISEKIVWIYILCQASQQNTAKPRIFDNHLTTCTTIAPELLYQAIEKLQSFGMVNRVRVRGAYRSVRNPGLEKRREEKRREEKRREERIIHAQTEVRAIDEIEFNCLYALFPRKIGKSPGWKVFKKEIRTPADAALLRKSIDNFVIHHKRNKTEKKFIPYFSTFMNQWRDWLDPATGDSDGNKKNKSSVEYDFGYGPEVLRNNTEPPRGDHDGEVSTVQPLPGGIPPE